MGDSLQRNASTTTPLVKDPVCGMDVDTAKSPHDHGDRQTEHGADHGGGVTAAPGEATEWTCPMHPQIRRPGPGSCPICGMALEPVTVTADSGPSPELADMTLSLIHI